MPAALRKSGPTHVSVIQILITLEPLNGIMAHAHGPLTIQNLSVDDVALGTLASDSALLLSSEFATTIDRTFLIKKIRYFLMISGLTAGNGPLLAGLSRGDASAAEVASAFTEFNSVGPSDTTQERTQDNVWNVIQNSWRAFKPGGTAAEMHLDVEISLGKGIPALENAGVQLHLFNADAAPLDTGGVCKGRVQLWGVWLK